MSFSKELDSADSRLSMVEVEVAMNLVVSIHR